MLSEFILHHSCLQVWIKRKLLFVSNFLVLVACGKSSSGDRDENETVGFSSIYAAPAPNYEEPIENDQFFQKLKPPYVPPYWINSLEMQDGDAIVSNILASHDREFLYYFPETEPSYDLISIVGWKPATKEMKAVSRDIFSSLEVVLDVQFKETNTDDGTNIISVSQSQQTNSSGMSFYPNTTFEIGSDLFMATGYSAPRIISAGLTNFDYEILLHEIGHAIGLKHPFEPTSKVNSILNDIEDHTNFTLMSYNNHPSTYDGAFRILDWMTLTKLYGVNDTFNMANDIYSFSINSGVLIIDGGGKDTIDESYASQDIFLNLNVATHSHKGDRSDYITSKNQLTISHGSQIENVITGSGNDYVIGNSLENIIITNGGSDRIFPAEAADTIQPGTGADIIDLSELVNSSDTIVVKKEDLDAECDTVYRFDQGPAGDIYDFKDVFQSSLNFLPLVEVGNIPKGIINNSIVRITGQNVSNAKILEGEFKSGGLFNQLSLFDKHSALFITSASQNTGETQNIMLANSENGTMSITPVATLLGNYLDIDLWVPDNFLGTDLAVII